VPAGRTLVTTAKIVNAGPDQATGITLTEPIPAGSTFVSAKPGAKCPAPVSNTLTCTIGSLTPGGSATVTLTVTPTRVGTLTSTVTVGATSTDPDSADRTDTTTTTVTNPNADLSITLTDTPDPVTVGSGSLTYTAVATNAGPATATGARIVDTLSSNVAFVSAKPGTKCSIEGKVITCRAGNLAPGASATITIVVNPMVAGTVMNSATVSSAAPDPDHSNDGRTVSTTVRPSGSAAGRLPDHVR
jgi:uncharacterized repeat protein (TIGR01451 family)